MNKTYNLVGIQNLLADTLTAQEISQAAADLFPTLYQKFTPNMTKPQQVEVVVDYAHRHNQILELLEYLEKDGRYRYDETAQDRINRLKSPISILNFESNAPYGLAEGFTGRATELDILDKWLRDEPESIMVLVGEAGMGKSALAWHWQLLTRAYYALFTESVLWWDCYQPNATARQFLGTALHYFGDDPTEYKNPRASLERFLEHLRSRSVLIVLDGIEHWLRAFHDIDISHVVNNPSETPYAHYCADSVAASLLIEVAREQRRGKLLLTSRLLPGELQEPEGTAITGVKQHLLEGLTPEDVFRYFSRLGLKTMWGEVQNICDPLAYHPLTLRLLAGYVLDASEAPKDLASAAQYDRQVTPIERRQQVLAQTYAAIPPIAQELLGYMVALRGRVERNTLKIIFEKLVNTTTNTDDDSASNKRSWAGQLFRSKKTDASPEKPKQPTSLKGNLSLLQRRGFIQWTRHQDKEGTITTTYDAHPLVRHYVYHQQPKMHLKHRGLATYFKAMPHPIIVKRLTDLAPTLEWYYHLTGAHRFDEAFDLFQERFYELMQRQLDVYQYDLMTLLKALFPHEETQPPQLSSEEGRGWVVNTLAHLYSMSGQPMAAIQLYQVDVAMLTNAGEKELLATALGNLADNQTRMGSLAAAAESCRRCLDLYSQIEKRYKKIAGHWYHGRLLGYQGEWARAKVELGAALGLALAEKAAQSQCVTWAYRAHLALLQNEAEEAYAAAEKAYKIAAERNNDRDRARAEWLLGWSGVLLEKHFPQAKTHLTDALNRSRKANLIEFEPAILLALAHLARAEGHKQESRQYIEEARQIALRAGYVLDLADIYNFLARLALDAADYKLAAQHANQARQYALCDGPPHFYKAAIDKAERVLNMLSYQV